MDNFLLPKLLIHKFEPTEWEGEVQLQTAEEEQSDVVLLHCWICQVLFDGNAKTMLILPDGYCSAVTSDKFCDQTAVRNGKGVLKDILQSADLVNECISHVQFLIDGKVSTQDKSII